MSLTKEDAAERYGSVQCTFSGYWKYSFSFDGVADDGAKIGISVGGNADDIYRFAVQPSTTQVMADAYAVTITKDGETIFESYE